MLRKFLIILESASFSCVLGKRVLFAKFYMLLGVNIARSLLQLVMNWPSALRGVSILNPELYQAVMYRESLKELRKVEHDGGLSTMESKLRRWLKPSPKGNWYWSRLKPPSTDCLQT